MALPGVESVERQGAPPRVGLAESPAGEESPLTEPRGTGGGATGAPRPARPPLLSVPPAGWAPHVPAVDSYSLRLVSTRRLYDAGTDVAGSPSLAPLVPTAVVRANPYDLDRLGVATGDPVRVRSARAALVLPAEADDGVTRGVVAVEFNLPAPDDRRRWRRTATRPGPHRRPAAVNDVRLESVG